MAQKKSWTTLSQAQPVHIDPDDIGNAEKYVEEDKAERRNIISQAKSPVKDLVTGYEKIINFIFIFRETRTSCTSTYKERNDEKGPRTWQTV